MTINDIGYDFHHDKNFCISRPNGSGDYLFLLIRSTAVFTLNGSDVIADRDSFILYNANTPQYYRANGCEYVNDWFHFSCTQDDIKRICALGIPFDQVVPLSDAGHIFMMIKYASHEFYSENLQRVSSMEHYMNLIFNKLSEMLTVHTGKAESPYYERLSLLRSRIQSSPQKDWRVANLAQELSMSVSYFQHLYKDVFGISAINDIIGARLNYAKFLLSTTNIPIRAVSEMCGYNNDTHFMSQFKAHESMTPTEYRALHHKTTG